MAIVAGLKINKKKKKNIRDNNRKKKHLLRIQIPT